MNVRVDFSYTEKKSVSVGRMSIRELQRKEVINTRNCASLGFVTDIEFETKCGKITALIVPGPGKICCLFGRETQYVIPWECVRQIGEDIILVCVEEECFVKDANKNL